MLDGALYVIGGEDGEIVHRSVERFDPATKMWSRVAEMSICRAYAGILLFRLFNVFSDSLTFLFVKRCRDARRVTLRCRGLRRYDRF